MIDRKCERSARLEQDSIQHARYLAHRDLVLLLARDCADVTHGGVGCRCCLRWPDRHRRRHRSCRRDCLVDHDACRSVKEGVSVWKVL